MFSSVRNYQTRVSRVTVSFYVPMSNLVCVIYILILTSYGVVVILS